MAGRSGPAPRPKVPARGPGRQRPSAAAPDRPTYAWAPLEDGSCPGGLRPRTIRRSAVTHPTPGERPMSSDDVTALERRVLRLSMVATASLAVLGVVWGILSGSSVILFDGAYGSARRGPHLAGDGGVAPGRRRPDREVPVRPRGPGPDGHHPPGHRPAGHVPLRQHRRGHGHRRRRQRRVRRLRHGLRVHQRLHRRGRVGCGCGARPATPTSCAPRPPSGWPAPRSAGR